MVTKSDLCDLSHTSDSSPLFVLKISCLCQYLSAHISVVLESGNTISNVCSIQANPSPINCHLYLHLLFQYTMNFVIYSASNSQFRKAYWLLFKDARDWVFRRVQRIEIVPLERSPEDSISWKVEGSHVTKHPNRKAISAPSQDRTKSSDNDSAHSYLNQFEHFRTHSW